MTIFFQTKQRDGQSSKKQFQLYASTMEEAIAEFSANMLKSIAEGTEYSYYGTEAELHEDFSDYKFEGAGYYAMPETVTIGREDFYATDAKFYSYREDVYKYEIEEEEDTVGGLGIN